MFRHIIGILICLAIVGVTAYLAYTGRLGFIFIGLFFLIATIGYFWNGDSYSGEDFRQSPHVN